MPYFPETYGNVIALKVQRESSTAKPSLQLLVLSKGKMPCRSMRGQARH